MFRIFINDGSQELPDDDIFYIVCKEGVYLKKKMGVMESMAPVPNISILQSVEATARMHIVPIPGPLFAKVISFFKEVYKEYRSEAIVLIFYDEENNQYKIFPPFQKVNYSAVDYNKGILLEGWQMIGTIHSHSSMSAFHSGTDDDDEKYFDGLHITIGDNDDPEPSISASIVANGTRFLIDPLDYIEDLALTVDVDQEENVPTRKYYKWVNGRMIETKTSNVRTYRKMDKRYVSTVSEPEKQFNSKWMDVVEYVTPTYHYGQYGGAYIGAGWGGAFDPNAWKDWRKNRPGQKVLPPPKGAIVPPQNVGPHKTAGIKFPEHDADINPCESCVFKNHKIDWVMEQLLEEVSGDDETKQLPEGMESYQCDQCHTEMVIPETQDATCPVCKTDEFLVDTSPFPDPEEDELAYQCTECQIEFTLADDKEPPICPACKTSDNITLVEGEFEDVKEEEDIPYECSSCHKKFFLITQEKCPHCGTNILETEADYQALSRYSTLSEDRVKCVTCQITLSVKDLVDGKDCPFCRMTIDPNKESDFLDPEQDAIEAAIAADQQVERLPIPDQGIVPINEPAKRKEGPFAFMKRLAQKRRNKGN